MIGGLDIWVSGSTAILSQHGREWFRVWAMPLSTFQESGHVVALYDLWEGRAIAIDHEGTRLFPLNYFGYEFLGFHPVGDRGYYAGLLDACQAAGLVIPGLEIKQC